MSPRSFIKAPQLDLATELGKAMARASTTAREQQLGRIYLNLTPEAKARCDQARALEHLERGYPERTAPAKVELPPHVNTRGPGFIVFEGGRQ